MTKLQKVLRALQNRLDRYISKAVKATKKMILDLVFAIAKLEQKLEIVNAECVNTENKKIVKYEGTYANQNDRKGIVAGLKVNAKKWKLGRKLFTVMSVSNEMATIKIEQNRLDSWNRPYTETSKVTVIFA